MSGGNLDLINSIIFEMQWKIKRSTTTQAWQIKAKLKIL